MRCPTGQKETKCYEINFSIDATWYIQANPKTPLKISRFMSLIKLKPKSLGTEPARAAPRFSRPDSTLLVKDHGPKILIKEGSPLCRYQS